MNESELHLRFRAFAIGILKLCDLLPDRPGSLAVANQLARCGPGAGANYRAACRARSKADFVSKLGIAQEEADEAAYWLDLILGSEMHPSPTIRPLYNEAVELTRILTASRLTAQRHLEQEKTARAQQQKKPLPPT